MLTKASAWCWGALFAAGMATASDGAPSREQAIDSLLAADRAWAQDAATQSFPDAVAGALADDAFVMLARGRSAQGPAAVRAALAAESGSHASWFPAWAGVSADGTQGFTLGYLEVTPAQGAPLPGKYLAYWRREAGGWRVVAYKRRPRAAGDVPREMAPPLVPTDATGDAPALAEIEAGVAARERAFSDAAQRSSLADAFARFGHARAVNMGGPADAAMVVGPAAIARAVSGGEQATGSSVSWSSDRIVAAASGDLALSIGMLRLNEAPKEAGVPREFPFFTVWYRAGGEGDWLYVAE